MHIIISYNNPTQYWPNTATDSPLAWRGVCVYVLHLLPYGSNCYRAWLSILIIWTTLSVTTWTMSHFWWERLPILEGSTSGLSVTITLYSRATFFLLKQTLKIRMYTFLKCRFALHLIAYGIIECWKHVHYCPQTNTGKSWLNEFTL